MHQNYHESGIFTHRASVPASAPFEYTPRQPERIDTGDTVGLDIDHDTIPEVLHDRRTGETIVRFSAPSNCVQPSITFEVGSGLRVVGLIERMDDCRVRVNCIPCAHDRHASVSRLFTPAVEERVELEIGARIISFMGPI